MSKEKQIEENMEKIKIEPYEDFEAIRRKAEDYIQRILLGASFYKRHGINPEPIVFMSGDIMNVIARGFERALVCGKETPTNLLFTVCGYRVKMVADTNVLSVGFDLL